MTYSLKNHCSNNSYGSVNYIKYIHTLTVSEPNNVCKELEGESEECWKITKKKDKAVMSHTQVEGNEEKQSKCLNCTF